MGGVVIYTIKASVVVYLCYKNGSSAGFASPAALSTLLRPINNSTGLSDKRFELFTAVQVSYRVHRANGLTPDEENWKLR